MPSSTEYLVIFAATLLVALLLVQLLGSSTSTSPLLKESTTYWASTYPLVVEDVKFASQYGGSLQLRVRNKSGKTLIIPQWGVYLDGYPNGVGPSSDVKINPFSHKDILVWPVESVFGKCENNSIFEYDLRISYKYVGDGSTYYISGAVPLRGQCNYGWAP